MALVEMKVRVGEEGRRGRGGEGGGLGELNLYTMAQQNRRSWQCLAVLAPLKCIPPKTVPDSYDIHNGGCD